MTIDSVDGYERSFKIVVRFSTDWFKGQSVIFSLSEKSLIRPYVNLSHVIPIVSLIYSKQKEDDLAKSQQMPPKRNLRCNYCSQAIFADEFALDKHIWEKHHTQGGEICGAKWNCELCTASFFTSVGLKIHKQKHEEK